MHLAEHRPRFIVRPSDQLVQVPRHEDRIVIVRVEQRHLDVNGRAVPSKNARPSLDRQHFHSQVIALFPIEDRLILHRQPTGFTVDRERAGRISKLVIELAILALVLVARDHLQHAEPVRQILHDADVVQVDLELGKIVVQIEDLDLDASSCRLQRVVHLRSVDLQSERVGR